MLENPKKRALRSKDGLEIIEYTRQKMTKEFFRYMFMAIFNSVFFFVLFYLLLIWDPLNMYPEVFAGCVAVGSGTVEAHYVHRRFTFKSTTPYKESLFWMMLVYSIIAVVSSITIWMLVNMLDIDPNVAWVINNCMFGLAYFAGLRLLAFPPELDSEE